MKTHSCNERTTPPMISSAASIGAPTLRLVGGVEELPDLADPIPAPMVRMHARLRREHASLVLILADGDLCHVDPRDAATVRDVGAEPADAFEAEPEGQPGGRRWMSIPTKDVDAVARALVGAGRGVAIVERVE